MGFNWEDEDTFRDVPDEVNEGSPEPSNVVGVAQMSPQQKLPVKGPILEPVMDAHDEAFVQSLLESEEEEMEAVLADANLRIELATLYKLIMNHDLFEGMDVDPRAVTTVHREIRKFARERMEIMLGMRQEAPKEAIVSSPFNDLEVTILKKLASAASKGATEAPDANKTAQVVKQAPRREGLNTIGGGQKPAARPAPVVQRPAPKQAVQSLAGKPQAPLQRQAKPVLESKPLEKHPSQMTEEEVLKRNEEASARQAGKKAVKSSSALPQPTYDQEEMLYTQRAMEMANPGAVSAIVAALNKSKSQ